MGFFRKKNEIPEKLKKFQQTWKTHFPNWEYRLWSDKDNYNLIKEHYPWFLEIYQNYKFPIQKADAIRPFILFHYGGMYVDLDYECLKNFEKLIDLDNKNIYLVRSPFLNENLQNSLMISSKNHPFLKNYINEMILAKNTKYLLHHTTILNTTGPNILDKTFEKYSQNVKLLDIQRFNPTNEKFLKYFHF